MIFSKSLRFLLVTFLAFFSSVIISDAFASCTSCNLDTPAQAGYNPQSAAAYNASQNYSYYGSFSETETSYIYSSSNPSPRAHMLQPSASMSYGYLDNQPQRAPYKGNSIFTNADSPCGSKGSMFQGADSPCGTKGTMFPNMDVPCGYQKFGRNINCNPPKKEKVKTWVANVPTGNDRYDYVHRSCEKLAPISFEYVDFRIKNGNKYEPYNTKLGNYRFRIFGCRRNQKSAYLNVGRTMQKDMSFFEVFDNVYGDCLNQIKMPDNLCDENNPAPFPEYILTAEITDYFMNICDEYDWNKSQNKEERLGSSEMTITWRLMDLSKNNVYWKGTSTGYGEVDYGEYNGEILLVERAFEDALVALRNLEGFEDQLSVRKTPEQMQAQKVVLADLEKAINPIKCQYGDELAFLKSSGKEKACQDCQKAPCVKCNQKACRECPNKKVCRECASQTVIADNSGAMSSGSTVDDNSGLKSGSSSETAKESIDENSGFVSGGSNINENNGSASQGSNIDENSGSASEGSNIDENSGSASEGSNIDENSGSASEGSYVDENSGLEASGSVEQGDWIPIPIDDAQKSQIIEDSFSKSAGNFCIENQLTFKEMTPQNLYKVRASIVSIENSKGKKGAGLIISDQYILTSADLINKEENNYKVKTINGIEFKANAFRVSPSKNVALMLLDGTTEFTPLPLNLELPEINKENFITLGLFDLDEGGEGYVDDGGKVIGYRYSEEKGAEIIVDTYTQSQSVGGALVDSRGNIYGIAHSGKRIEDTPDMFIPIETALKSLDVELCGRAFLNQVPPTIEKPVSTAIDSTKDFKEPEAMEKTERK